jgi:hypothetical protein
LPSLALDDEYDIGGTIDGTVSKLGRIGLDVEHGTEGRENPGLKRGRIRGHVACFSGTVLRHAGKIFGGGRVALAQRCISIGEGTIRQGLAAFSAQPAPAELMSLQGCATKPRSRTRSVGPPRFGGIDIVVNNASLFIVGRSVRLLPP